VIPGIGTVDIVVSKNLDNDMAQFNLKFVLHDIPPMRAGARPWLAHDLKNKAFGCYVNPP
jgi:hypothetical protein